MTRRLAPLLLGGALTAVGFAPGCSVSSSDACDHLLQALLDGTRCGGYAKPLSDTDRARWRTYCESVLALPDQGETASIIDACAAEEEDASCDATHVDACDRGQTGTRAVGAPCTQSSQCASGRCEASGKSDGCGTCGATSLVGQPCTIGTACTPGDACDAKTMTCATKVYLAEGQTCDGYGLRCDDGLYCQGATKTCQPKGGEGAACAGNGACRSGFACSQSVCTVLPGVGSPCLNGACGAGLVCDSGGHCITPAFAEPGQPCGPDVFCRVGSCSPGSPSTCPTVIADGQPCDVADFSQTCDTFASCVSGVCQLAVSACQ